jgi:spore coat polysaccharide biosynthesis protein SpsF
MIGAVVQARMASTRLPGKVMLDAAGKPLLEHLHERLLQCATLEKIILATSVNRQDDVIANFCKDRAITVFRGNEADVLDRYFQAARQNGLTVVVRITSDCPLIDPMLVDEMVRFFVQHEDRYDLVTNRHPLTYPDGLDVDVMNIAGLEHAWKNATESHQREHTIPFFWETGMRVFNFEHPENLFQRYRWTLDYPEDYALIKRIFDALYRQGESFTTQNIRDFIAANPELQRINAHYIPS